MPTTFRGTQYSRALRAGILRGTHTLVAGCAFLLAACGAQPTSPDSSEQRNPTFAAQLQSPEAVRICRKGTFEGVWIKDSGFEDRGRIEAVWLGARGDTLGMLTGAFGPDPEDGSLRWRATVSGVNLTVILFELEGTFTFTDPRLCPVCGTGQGEMTGLWRDSRTAQKGRVFGMWGDISLPFEERVMPLSGRWTGVCRGQTPTEIQEKPD